MNIGLVYSDYPRWPKFKWVHEALTNLGYVVFRARNMDELKEIDQKCEIIIFEHREPGPGRKNIIQYASQKKAFWAYWWFDLFLGQTHQDLIALYGPLAKCMDVTFVKEREWILNYANLSINAKWMDQGCPKQMGACEHRDEPEFDVLVIGTCNEKYPERIQDTLTLLKEGFRVGWAGDGFGPPPGVTALPWTDPLEFPKLLSRTALALSVDARTDVDGYRSDRLYLMAGAGACILHRCPLSNFPFLNVIGYDSAEELIHHAKRLVYYPMKRENNGREARRLTMQHHTYEDYCQRVIDEIGKIQQGATRQMSLSNV